MLVKWTIRSQLYGLQSLKTALCGKLRPRVDLYSFVGSNKEEEEEGLTPYSSMPKALGKQVIIFKESPI